MKTCGKKLKKLRPHPQRLDYLRAYYSMPERIAQYRIQSIWGSMDKVSSARSEQNHDSIDQHKANTGILEPEVLVQKLIERQGELSTKRAEKAN
jgi:hypothetical protein